MCSSLLLALALVASAPPPSPAGFTADAPQGFDSPSGKTFSGDFDSTPADQAVRKLLDAAGLSVVMPGGAYPPVTAHFKDAPVEDALGAICAEAGLTATRRGSVVTLARGGAAAGVSLRRPGFNVDVDDAQGQGEQAAAAPDAGADSDAPAASGDRIAAGDITLGAGQRVRDLLTVGGKIRLEPGAHARQVSAMGGSIDVAPGASVERDAVAIGGDVHVASGASVGGGATAVGGQVRIDRGAKVHGRGDAVPLPPLDRLDLPEAPEGRGSVLLWLGKVVAEFAVYFALGLLVLLGWPRRQERLLLALERTPARATVVGILGSAALLLLLTLLAVTCLGLLLWPVVGLGVAAATVLGFSALATLIGRSVPARRRLTPVGQLALGTLVLTGLSNLPYLGKPALALAWLVILGAALVTRLGAQDAAGAASFPIDDALGPDRP